MRDCASSRAHSTCGGLPYRTVSEPESLARLGWRPLSNSSTTIREELGTVSSAVTIASIRKVPSERSRASTSLPLLVSFSSSETNPAITSPRDVSANPILMNGSSGICRMISVIRSNAALCSSLPSLSANRTEERLAPVRRSWGVDSTRVYSRIGLGLRVEDIGVPQIAPYSSDRSSQRKKFVAACPTVSDDFFITRKDGARRRDLTIRVPAPRKIIVPDLHRFAIEVRRIEKCPISYQQPLYRELNIISFHAKRFST